MRVYSKCLFVLAALACLPLAATAQQADRLVISKNADTYVLAVPVSKLTLAVPASGLTVASTPRAGAADNPRYFMLNDSSRGLVISGWFEPADNFPGASSAWDGDRAEWKKHGLPEPTEVAFEKLNGWEAVFYEMPLPTDAKNHNVRAHFVRDGTWIDIHLSLTNRDSGTASRAALRDLLNALRVSAASGGS